MNIKKAAACLVCLAVTVSGITAPQAAEKYEYIVELSAAPAYISEDSGGESEERRLVAESLQLDAVKSIESETSAEIEYCYTELYDGIAVSATESDIEKIAKMDNVVSVTRAQIFSVPETEITEDTQTLGLQSAVHDAGDSVNAQTLRSGMTEPTYGGGTLIAIIDSEFLITHDAFAPSGDAEVKFTENDISSKLGKLTKNNLRVSDVYKSAKIPFAYDYACNDSDVRYDVAAQLHGTHVAGLAAGNSSSLRGVAPGAQLALFKVSETNAAISETAIIAAMEDAVKLDADVISMSIGSPYTACPDNSALVKAIKNISADDSEFFSSAGNSGFGPGYRKSGGKSGAYPEEVSYDTGGYPGGSPFAAAVGAADLTGDTAEMADFSSYCINETVDGGVEISASGCKMYSSYGTGASSYATSSGTSMASPIAAGSYVMAKEFINEKLGSIAKEDITVMLENSADEVCKDGIPYTPRVQGAGNINLGTLSETTVAIYDKNTQKRKRGMVFAGAADSNNVSFTLCLENLGSESVTYNLSGIAICDKTEDGKVIAGSERVEADFDMADSVTAAAGETVEIPVTLSISDSVRNGLDAVFENGFYLDGFIRFSGDNELSVPFTSFIGDYTAASAFDGDYYSDKNLYGENYITASDKILGVNAANSEKRGDRLSAASEKLATLGINYYLLRNASKVTAALYDSSGKAVSVTVNGNTGTIVSYRDKEKYCLYSLSYGLPSALAEGEYTLELEATLASYPNAKSKREYTITVDNTAPEIISAEYADGKITVKARDNFDVQYAEINGVKAAFEDGTAEIAYSTPGTAAVRVYDWADNSAEYAFTVAEATPTPAPEPMKAEFSYSGTTATLVNAEDEPAAVSCIGAFYGKTGELEHIEIAEVSLGVGEEKSLEFSYDGEYEVFKAFAWNSVGGMRPVTQ